MNSQLRDGLLAAVALAVCLGALARMGELAVLRRPGVAALGAVCALAVEAAFVAETPVAGLWERPAVQAGATGALLAGGVALALTAGPWVLGAVVWGIATFFGLLALVVSGRWPVEPSDG